jgi:hypothetical protein
MRTVCFIFAPKFDEKRRLRPDWIYFTDCIFVLFENQEMNLAPFNSFFIQKIAHNDYYIETAFI